MPTLPPPLTEKGVDLHAHTTASDGSLTPTELVQKAVLIGLDALAVTDHDTLGGLSEAREEAARLGLPFVPGVELSVEDDAGRFHLLGYGFTPNAELDDALIRLRTSRAERNREMAAKMAELGLPVTMDDVRAEAGPDAQVIARPHFAQAFIKRGIVGSVAEAFDKYLSVGRPLYMPKDVLTPADAAALLHAAGGVTVMAHPALIPLDDDALAARVGLLAEAGVLDGIEAFYSQHSPAQTERFLALAKRHDLLATGGSDFHGTPKPHVSLGIVYDDKPAPLSVLTALRARLTGTPL